MPRVKAWAASRVFLNFGDAPVDEQIHHAENLVAYWRYCVDLVKARFDGPRDDLPSDLVRIYAEGDRSISLDEMAGLVYGQLTAGHETTTALLATGLKELLTQRDRWEELCADPARAPAAVEEMLRVATPVFAWKRKAKTAARIAGVEIPEGANVLLLLGSANHDADVFPDPERIDLGRPNASRHLAFGHGIHFCLGASLARLEAQVVLEELTTRLPWLRLVPGQTFDFSPNSTFRPPARARRVGRRAGTADRVAGGRAADRAAATADGGRPGRRRRPRHRRGRRSRAGVRRGVRCGGGEGRRRRPRRRRERRRPRPR